MRQVVTLLHTASKDRHPVAECQHLLEEVRDEEDGHTLVAEAADHLEELCDVDGIEARRGLVQHEHPWSVDHGAGDGDKLAAGGSEVRQQGSRVQLGQSELGQHRGGAFMRRTPGDADATVHLVAQHHVLTDAQVLDQVRFLERGLDAEGPRVSRTAETDGLAVHEDLPCFDRVHAEQRLDERGLPRSVLAEESVHLARVEVEVDPVERDAVRERDGDPPHLHRGVGRSVPPLVVTGPGRASGLRADRAHRRRCPYVTHVVLLGSEALTASRRAVPDVHDCSCRDARGRTTTSWITSDGHLGREGAQPRWSHAPRARRESGCSAGSRGPRSRRSGRPPRATRAPGSPAARS